MFHFQLFSEKKKSFSSFLQDRRASFLENQKADNNANLEIISIFYGNFMLSLTMYAIMMTKKTGYTAVLSRENEKKKILFWDAPSEEKCRFQDYKRRSFGFYCAKVWKIDYVERVLQFMMCESGISNILSTQGSFWEGYIFVALYKIKMFTKKRWNLIFLIAFF